MHSIPSMHAYHTQFRLAVFQLNPFHSCSNEHYPSITSIFSLFFYYYIHPYIYTVFILFTSLFLSILNMLIPSQNFLTNTLLFTLFLIIFLLFSTSSSSFLNYSFALPLFSIFLSFSKPTSGYHPNIWTSSHITIFISNYI